MGQHRGLLTPDEREKDKPEADLNAPEIVRAGITAATKHHHAALWQLDTRRHRPRRNRLDRTEQPRTTPYPATP